MNVNGTACGTGGGASRRDCLKVAALAVGGVAVGAVSSSFVGHLGPAPAGPWRALTPDEARLVEAVAEQIVPADRDPGAKEAGVVVFIDRQLAGPYRRFLEKYRLGLACLVRTSQAMFGRPFESLAWDEQTKLLQALESNKAPKDIWTSPSAPEFFNLICDHSLQGFYGSPRHGGNRNYASYRMLGIEYPRVIGQNRYGG